MISVQTLKRWLEHRRLSLMAALVGGGLVASTGLGVGVVMDDHVHRAVVQHPQSLPGLDVAPTDLFNLMPGEPVNRALMDLGVAPWWTDPQMKLAFWRPLTSLTHTLDYTLWPQTPWIMHLHSILWFVALLLVVGLAYRRLGQGPAWIAGLATVLYALDEAHGLPVAWLANRSIIPAALFAVVTLIVHHKWRGEGWRRGAWLGPVCLGVGLLWGEFAIGATAYLFSYALCLDQGRWRERLLSLAPYAAVVVIWRGVYQALGHGALYSGVYIDPVRSPLDFAQALVERLPIFVATHFVQPTSSLWVMASRPLQIAQTLWSVAWLGLLLWLLWPVLKREAEARFWALGMMISAIPLCATWPHDRMLFLVGLGGMALVARFLSLFVEAPPWRPQGAWWKYTARVVAVCFVFFHGVVAPVMQPTNGLALKQVRVLIDSAASTIPTGPSWPRQTLVVVNAPVIFMGSFLAIWRQSLGLPNPERARVLAVSLDPVTIARDDAHTLRVRPERGFLSSPLGKLVRHPDRPLPAGQVVSLPGVEYTVLEVTLDGRPQEVQVRFDRPLEDPSLVWVVWEKDRMVPWSPPSVGQQIVLPDIDGMRLLLPAFGIDPE